MTKERCGNAVRPAEPHPPLSPFWTCRTCHRLWPCEPARAALLDAYGGHGRRDLLGYLGRQLLAAEEDLYQLYGSAGPSAYETFRRFVGWARRPPVDAGGKCHHSPAAGDPAVDPGEDAPMSDAYVVGDPDGLSPLLIEIRNLVARELHAQLALRDERIELADVPEVAYAVTVGLDRLLSSPTGRAQSSPP